MFSKKKFRIKVLEQEKTLRNIADCLEINAVTLWRKMNGESDFTREEIEKLIYYLKIDNLSEIFFTNEIT